MKKLLVFATALLFISSCSPKENVNSIQNEIIRFYDLEEVKNYKPIEFSKLDTIRYAYTLDGSLVRLTGTVVHQLTMEGITGNIISIVDTFDVTVFKNNIIAIPRGNYP